MPSKAERSEQTRAALVAAARALFAERGFADTSTEAVVQAARVTRGALYHHFTDKTALFQAVYEAIEADLVNGLVAGLGDVTDPVDVLIRGAELFLDACLDPAVQRVVLVEGPAVLGWERWREIDQAYGLGVVTAALRTAMDAGAIREAPVAPLAHILLGGLVEGGMLLASSTDPTATRAEVGAAVQQLIEGLRA